MADRAISPEKILPCFLDRLTDHYPKAKKESREYRSVTLKRYRDSVLRDLQWLLNCGAHPPHSVINEFDYAKKSVVNYGIRSLSGMWTSGETAEGIAENIRKTLLQFEPRIKKHTLRVDVIKDDEDTKSGNTKVNLEISGELYVEPIPEKLYIKTEIDLETGLCNVS